MGDWKERNRGVRHRIGHWSGCDRFPKAKVSDLACLGGSVGDGRKMGVATDLEEDACERVGQGGLEGEEMVVRDEFEKL